MRWIAFLAALFMVAPATAQVNPTNMPASTVIGRLGSGPGPAQAIPFATLSTAIGGVSLSGNNTFTATNNFTGTLQIGGVTIVAPGSGNLVGTTDTQTLTNKSIDGSEITSGTISGSWLAAINLASSANGGVSGTLPVTNGGTGQTTLSANGVMIGEGTSGVHVIATNTPNLCLVSQNGADPIWASCSSSTATPGAYITVNGTTVAAPFVAGAVYATFGGL